MINMIISINQSDQVFTIFKINIIYLIILPGVHRIAKRCDLHVIEANNKLFVVDIFFRTKKYYSSSNTK